MTTGTFTEQDTETFATKLEAFSRTLTTGEQAVLTLIEQQLGTMTTTGTDNDVQGYMIDLGEVAMVRQREMLHEAERLRSAGGAEPDVTAATATRIGLWQQIAQSLGRQTSALSPRATGQPATG